LSALFLSSGDLIADRRYAFAKDLQARGDLDAAADLYRQAIECAPDFAAAWFALGELQAARGAHAEAIAAFRRALACDPADRHGAILHLMRLGAAAPGEMPQDYVRSLFDHYADEFDRALTEGLHYRAPELLRMAVEAVCARTGRAMTFASLLDLGCGTGLAGEAFRAHAARATGVDLSAGMIAQARRKNVYDRLETAGIAECLAGEAAAARRHDLVVAADVFVYFNDLAPVFAAVARVLAADGLFAFTVETHDGKGTILRETLRYAHAADTVRDALAQAALSPLMLEAVSTRTEKRAPVSGLLVVARHA
jgi:predicted TPR repeat methyltransferase